MTPSRLLPLFLDLDGRDVLVVGAGNVASKKIRDLVEACAVVHVVAPNVSEDVNAMDCDGAIRLDTKPSRMISGTVTTAQRRNAQRNCPLVAISMARLVPAPCPKASAQAAVTGPDVPRSGTRRYPPGP